MLAPIYNAVQQMLNRWTATLAGRIDAAITSRADATYYTSTRAAKLDNLDAAVSGCATSAVWTGTKAGYLDAAISSRLSACVKSVQTGLVDTSSPSTGTDPETRYVDITVSSVNTGKCIVVLEAYAGVNTTGAATALTSARKACLNKNIGDNADGDIFACKAYLTSATNLRIFTGGSATYTAISGRWQIIEFY